MNPTLILIADSSRARLLRRDTAAGLREVGGLALPEARMREGDLSADRPGRQADAYRSAGLSGPGLKEAEVERFAASLVRATLDALGEGETAAMVAPPELLGRLRGHIPHAARARVPRTASGDYTRVADLKALEGLLRRKGVLDTPLEL